MLGEHGNAGRAALAWGPLVLAYDAERNPGLPAAADAGAGRPAAAAGHAASRRRRRLGRSRPGPLGAAA